MKLGIIGAGRIGRVHAESVTRFVKGAAVEAIADPFMNAETEKWARDAGIPKIYKDYKKILSDPEIEAVLICSSTDTHSAISLEAIAAGKHIFCEKPVDHDVEKIKKVMDALAGTKLKYQVGFNRRFDHNFRAAREAVKAGIHDFDMVRFISGDEVDEVYASGAVLVDPEIGEAGDIDTAVITLKLKSGAIAVINNCRRAAYGYDQRLEAFGSLGQVEVRNDTDSTAVISNADGVTAEKPKYFFLERYMAAYTAEIESFVNAVEKDTDTEVGAADGLAPVLIGLAAARSVRENRPVKVAEIAAEYGL